MPELRRIVHVDMDAFFTSVEQRDDPSLRGRPVAVGGDALRRGVVAGASYEARAFGVHSAMPMGQALRLCPKLVVVHPDMSRYKAVSSQVMAIFRSVTPLVEPLSVDEAYLDVTENAWGEPLGMAVARRLKAAIREVTSLTASAGVAPNKLLAKIASGWKKPDGLTVIAPERVEAFLEKLPVEAIWGVGPATARRLHEVGVVRAVDLRTADATRLREVVGRFAETLVRLAHGVDERPVVPNRAAKSCGAEETYAEDLTSLSAIEAEVDDMSRRCATWLVRKSLFARTVTIKIRYAGFITVTRSESRPQGTREEAAISSRARALLAKTEAGRRPVRLVGVSVHGFSATSVVMPTPEEEGPQLRLPFDGGS